MKLLTADQVRAWDEFTIKQEPITSLDLMERAAKQCTRWIVDHALFNGVVKIFCGKGNNGGDGLAIARQLVEQDVAVEIFILEFGAKGTEDFQANLTRLHRVTKHIHFIQSKSLFPVVNNNDIVIDALHGLGLNRPLEGLTAALVEHLNDSGALIVSIDIPSGMYADKSSKGNTMVRARHTLTFQVLKPCFLASENSASIGKVEVLDIGLHPGFDPGSSTLQLTSLIEARNVYRPRDAFSHKGSFGHTLIIGGAEGKAGAAIIAADAAIHSGAGLTTVHLLNGDNTSINTRCPEVMTMAGDELVKKNLAKFSSIAIGPGLGTDDIAGHLVSLLVENYAGRLLMDADALNVLAQHKDWLDQLPPSTVLTPHPKEFDRLFGEHGSEFDRWEKALTVSKERGCIIILKGHHTLIAVNGSGYLNTTGNAGLAKGGSGDALTGVIAALLAQGYEAAAAAQLGVFLHGLAADVAVRDQAEESLTASDVIASLGKAFELLSNAV